MNFRFLLKILPFTILLFAGRVLKETSVTATAAKKPIYKVGVLAKYTQQPDSLVLINTTKQTRNATTKSL